MHGIHILSDIGMAIVAATAAALAGPRPAPAPDPRLSAWPASSWGPRWAWASCEDRESIEIISEIGLILLLFIIGLEMDLQKLVSAGRSLVLAGALQFPICVALGLGLRAGPGLARWAAAVSTPPTPRWRWRSAAR